ncbi:MAG: glycosyl transferase family protein [Puniceicoccaceae bacterium 5H]|nr:MAG: glycosyl transferase family protein [Puniceicoccaceae bacterium 5H]
MKDALTHWNPVWVVIDGSSDGSAELLKPLQEEYGPRLRVIERPINGGKGAAVYEGTLKAVEAGYTHVLTMDADGQHPAELIPELMRAARAHPKALVMGKPVFGKDVPTIRLLGRQLTIAWTSLETLFSGLGDTLFGMRVYPAQPLIDGFEQATGGKGYDFDPELAVRLTWMGCRPYQIRVPVRYLSADEGGVSHFHYLRDNVRLTILHFRLLPEWILFRLWRFLPHRLRWLGSSVQSL